MNLRYVTLSMDYDSGYQDSDISRFNYSTRFICNFLSIQIRKIKWVTDGTFNMIAVTPSKDIKHIYRIIGEKALEARVVFNQDYKDLAEEERYEHYLNLLEKGYRICSEHKIIPLDKLLELHQEFRKNGYKNEWLHKNKKFKEQGIEVSLNCSFTSFDFRLLMTINDLKTKKEIISGTVIRTKPDEVHFDSLFKDILIVKNKLIITEFQDRPKFIFNLSDILKGNFSFEISDVGLDYIPYTG